MYPGGFNDWFHCLSLCKSTVINLHLSVSSDLKEIHELGLQPKWDFHMEGVDVFIAWLEYKAI